MPAGIFLNCNSSLLQMNECLHLDKHLLFAGTLKDCPLSTDDTTEKKIIYLLLIQLLWAISFGCSWAWRKIWRRNTYIIFSFLQTADVRCKLFAGWFDKLILTIPWPHQQMKNEAAWIQWAAKNGVSKKRRGKNKDAKRNEPTSPVPAVQSI